MVVDAYRGKRTLPSWAYSRCPAESLEMSLESPPSGASIILSVETVCWQLSQLDVSSFSSLGIRKKRRPTWCDLGTVFSSPRRRRKLWRQELSNGKCGQTPSVCLQASVRQLPAFFFSDIYLFWFRTSFNAVWFYNCLAVRHRGPQHCSACGFIVLNA